MDNKNDDKVQEILNQHGQGSVDRAMQGLNESTNETKRDEIEAAEVTDETSRKIKEEAEATRRASKILKKLESDEDVQNKIAEISEKISEQLYIKRHFPENSKDQQNVDRCVREELIKIVGQVAKEITAQTMENISHKEKNIREKEKNERYI